MWSITQHPLTGTRKIKYTIEQDGVTLAYNDFLEKLLQNTDFRDFFISVLKNSPFDAFRWETPPLTDANSDQMFEFMLIASPSLATRPDLSTFAKYFTAHAPGDVTYFESLGRDALLVIPCPDENKNDFAHLAAFTQHAAMEQQHALWSKVGELVLQRLGPQPLWLSTAGAGVAWLHVRLDSRPKYYNHQPYRDYQAV